MRSIRMMIRFSFFSVFLLNFQTLFCQINFQKQFHELETWGKLHGQAVVQNFDGGYVIAGYIAHPGENDEMFLIRTNTWGDTIWTRRYNFTTIYGSNTLVRTFDNCFVLSPLYSDSGNTVILMKIGQDGNTIWKKYFNAGYKPFIYGVSQTSDSGFLIYGRYRYNETAPDFYFSALLIKTDSSGNQVWLRTIKDSDPSTNEAVTCIAETPDADYFFSGFIEDQWYIGGLGLSLFMGEVSHAGDSLFVKVYPSFNPGSYCTMYDLSPAIGGGFMGLAEWWFGIFSWTSGAPYLVKLTYEGDTVWTKEISKQGCTAQGTSLISFNYDSYIFCGSYWNCNPVGPNAYAVKVDLSGNVIWERDYLHGAKPHLNGIVGTYDQGFVMTGQTGELESYLYLVKTDESGIFTGFSLKKDINRIDIYPNPCSSGFSFNIPSGFSGYRLSDLNGTTVCSDISKKIPGKTCWIELKDYNPGLFILTIFANNREYHIKIIHL